MKNAMETSFLWQRTFADAADPRVARLIASLRNARSRIEQLTSKISSSLPTLTIHGLSHLDSLWTVASTIAGDDFNLNPLEGYIFGSAVLLHDSALCFEAYSGGKQAVQGTVQWRDAYNRRKHYHGKPDLDEVDFEALRSLHAARAANLATDPWDTEKDPIYIIDDTDLREQYGHLIGEIASSHHWNIDHVSERFSFPCPPATFLSQDWEADPLKIACLLRAADAGHMDSSRAPTFLLKILEMNSVSRDHWVAQNHLGQLIVKHDNPAQLVIASTAPFRQDEASAWWVAFDLVTQFDNELKQCDRVLAETSTHERSFARKGVAGAGNVKDLAKFIRTDGWEPVDSSVHVSDVTALVSTLGGEHLYGHDADRIAIALRELVQNAADAISARRLVEKPRNFRGHITIRLRRNSSNDHYIIQVDDDGVGMSSTTLSSDLLDFGRSFWASERVCQEFPGLNAAGHSPRGRFGIGFFSIFMAADSVRVFSRRFDNGLEDTRCLSFDNGLSMRPTITERKPEDIGMGICTRVELLLKQELGFDPHKIEIRGDVTGHQNFHVPFSNYVAALVSGIDVPISVDMDEKCTSVHNGFPPNLENRSEWLRALSYASSGVNRPAAELVDNIVPRLREIREGETCYGLAAINIDPINTCDFLSAKSVGGFAAHDTLRHSFVGLISYLPSNAKRDPGEITAPRHVIKEWLLEQVGLLNSRLSPLETVFASYSLCHFDYDPIDVLKGVPIIAQDGTHFLHFQDLLIWLRGGSRLGFRLSRFVQQHLDEYGMDRPVADFATCLVMGGGKFNRAEIGPNGPSYPRSLIGVIHRSLVALGVSPTWTRHRDLYSGPFGKCDGLELCI